jgi:hypothetical protein
MNLIKAIGNKNYDDAKGLFAESISQIVEMKLLEMKKMLVAKEQEMSPRQAYDGGPKARQEKLKRDVVESTESTEELDEGRIAIVKARVRGGKIQRRKKVSNVAGYTLRGGQLKRMSVTERRNRRLGQRRGKIKRRAKLNRALMKRARSLRKRASIGL